MISVKLLATLVYKLFYVKQTNIQLKHTAFTRAFFSDFNCAYTSVYFLFFNIEEGENIHEHNRYRLKTKTSIRSREESSIGAQKSCDNSKILFTYRILFKNCS